MNRDELIEKMVSVAEEYGDEWDIRQVMQAVADVCQPQWVSVVKGWRLLSADFSLQSSEKSKTGSVTLVRDSEGKRAWYKLDDSLLESDDCPDLYVTGKGEDIIEAIMNANSATSHAKPLPSPPVDDKDNG